MPVVLEHMPVVQSPAVLGTGKRERERVNNRTAILSKPNLSAVFACFRILKQ